MELYAATLIWKRGDQPFTDKRYSRVHLWQFDGGVTVPASSSPLTVPLPLSSAVAVDPEEAFVAALASCHMLWFLALAAKRGFRIDLYTDNPEGIMDKNADGKTAITRVTLHPEAIFSGDPAPSRADIEQMHNDAHDRCFIANSIRSEVAIEPVFDGPA
jgi:organic hydroperoxide reductase OsmC/OhrA